MYKFFVAISLFLASACTQKEAPLERRALIVSLSPYQKIVESIAGQNFSVRTIVPAGANPHAYEPTAKEVSALQDGVLWFTIGEPFEKKIFPVLEEKNEHLGLVDLKKPVSYTLKGCCCEHAEDRHFWLSPRVVKAQVVTIVEALSARFPEDKLSFEENGRKVIEDLDQLDQKLTAELQSVKGKTFLVAHSAFGHFCRDYELNEISVEKEGKEPTMIQASQLIEEAKNARFAIAMPEHSNKGVELIASKLGIEVIVMDPYAPDLFETTQTLGRLLAEERE
jgi:zinc transport system substrate-binding protein